MEVCAADASASSTVGGAPSDTNAECVVAECWRRHRRPADGPPIDGEVRTRRPAHSARAMLETAGSVPCAPAPNVRPWRRARRSISSCRRRPGAIRQCRSGACRRLGSRRSVVLFGATRRRTDSSTPSISNGSGGIDWGTYRRVGGASFRRWAGCPTERTPRRPVGWRRRCGPGAKGLPSGDTASKSA